MKAKTEKAKSNFSITSIMVIVGIILMTALWDSGWKPHNAFLMGILFMLTPMTIIGLFRMYENRERLLVSYENAKLVFGVLKAERRKAKEAKKQEKEKRESEEVK